MSNKYIQVDEFLSNVKLNPSGERRDKENRSYFYDIDSKRIYLSGKRNRSTAAMITLLNTKKIPLKCICCDSKAKSISFNEKTGLRPIASNGKELTIDHIKPKYHGGEDSIDNYQIMCSQCNRLKGHVDIENVSALRMYVKVRYWLIKNYPSRFANSKTIYQNIVGMFVNDNTRMLNV
jgi:hypothetical protein